MTLNFPTKWYINCLALYCTLEDEESSHIMSRSGAVHTFRILRNGKEANIFIFRNAAIVSQAMGNEYVFYGKTSMNSIDKYKLSLLMDNGELSLIIMNVLIEMAGSGNPSLESAAGGIFLTKDPSVNIGVLFSWDNIKIDCKDNTKKIWRPLSGILNISNFNYILNTLMRHLKDADEYFTEIDGLLSTCDFKESRLKSMLNIYHKESEDLAKHISDYCDRLHDSIENTCPIYREPIYNSSD